MLPPRGAWPGPTWPGPVGPATVAPLSSGISKVAARSFICRVPGERNRVEEEGSKKSLLHLDPQFPSTIRSGIRISRGFLGHASTFTTGKTPFGYIDLS